MANGNFEENPFYWKYVELLRSLHGMIANGEGDDASADETRDLMDAAWHNLNEKEIARVRGLSVDLYSLGIESEPEPEKPSKEDQSLMLQVESALQEKDWDNLLWILRKTEKCFQLSLISYLRGGVWWDLNDRETAILFYEHAAKLAPENINYQCILLDRLTNAKKYDRARFLANNAIEGNTHPNLVIQSSNVIFNETRTLTTAKAKLEYRRLIPILKNALTLAVDLPTSERQFSIEILGIVELGMCYEHLAQYEEATEQYTRALRLQPNNDAARVARGILNYGLKTDESIKDFDVAISLETPLMWPFFFQAHYSLCNSNFESCVEMADKALSRNPGLSAKGDLLEWKAISGAMLGWEDDAILLLFEDAMNLATHSLPRIRRNLGEYKNWYEEGQRLAKPTISWDLASDEETRDFGISERLATL